MSSRFRLLSLVLISWLVPSSPAMARLAVIAVDQDPKTAEVYVRPGRVFVMKLDCRVTHIEDPGSHYFRIHAQNVTDEITVEIARDAHNIAIEPVFKCKEYTLNLTIRTSHDERMVSRAAVVVRVRDPQQISEMKAQLAAAMAERDKAYAQSKAAQAQLDLTTLALTAEQRRVRELEQRVQDLTPLDKSREEKALLRELDITATLRTLAQSPSCGDPGIVVCGKRWAALNRYGILHFTVANNTSADFAFSSVHAFRIDSPGNLAGSVRIGHETPADPDKVHGRVPAHGRLAVSVIIREHEQIGQKLQIELAGPNVQTAIRIVDLDPPPPEPSEGFGRITIRVQPSFGAVWLANPVNKEELDATSLMGLGVRGSYALHKLFAVEAEFAGIQSNDAGFTGVTYEGTTGDMLRSTSGARFLLGGALRLGRKYQPYARLGVGAQVVDHDVRFVTGQDATTGPGDGLSFDVLGWFGSGLDIQLGNHWTLGAGFSSTVQTKGAMTLEGGVQLGYGWGGYVRD